MAGLARADVEAFRSAIAREAGLRFDDDKLPFLCEVLATRIRETRAANAGTYLEALPGAEHEIGELARTLSVCETYVLRNRAQFRALEAILRQRASGLDGGPARGLRLLSAGCSSGEEAYSLAITVREVLGDLRGWTISILAVDFDPETLAKARAGSYSNWSLRETPDVIRDRYFRRDGARHVVVDAVRDMVRFEQQNLARPPAGFWRREAFDIVLCRNVLMYFVPEAARRVVANIARALSPGGFLFLGHAENLRGLSHAFALRHSHDTFYYQRKDSREDVEIAPAPDDPEPALPADGSWFDAIGRASLRIEALSREAEPAPTPTPPRASAPHDLAPAMSLLQQERFQEALRLLSGLQDQQPDALLLRAMLLVSTGDLAGAEHTCAQLLRIDDLDAGAHYIMAICREHARDRSGAVEHSHMAAYLDPEFAMPHLQLGRIARRSGDRETARRELGLALGLLPREQAARILLFGGGFGRDALMQLCLGELRACGGDR